MDFVDKSTGPYLKKKVSGLCPIKKHSKNFVITRPPPPGLAMY